MSNQTYVKLNNGVEMPMAGIGTFMLSPDEAENSVVNMAAIRELDEKESLFFSHYDPATVEMMAGLQR